jgi:hypothetical protein
MGIMCALVVTAGLSVSPPPLPSPQSVAESLLFRTPLTAFIVEAQSVSHDARLDWTTDGCSAPAFGSTGRSFDFYAACWRHDFGYRNMSRIKNGRLWTEPLRLRIDERFRKDMRDSCTSKVRVTRLQCLAWAEAYFRAVRNFGSP